MNDNKSNIFPGYNDKKLRTLKRVIWFFFIKLIYKFLHNLKIPSANFGLNKNLKKIIYFLTYKNIIKH